MQTLKDLMPMAIANCPEFLETLQEEIIEPLEKHGAEFQGMSATGDQDIPDPVGVYTLIFQLPPNKILEIPRYSDEGTESHHYCYFGTLYIIIPMPF